MLHETLLLGDILQLYFPGPFTLMTTTVNVCPKGFQVFHQWYYCVAKYFQRAKVATNWNIMCSHITKVLFHILETDFYVTEILSRRWQYTVQQSKTATDPSLPLSQSTTNCCSSTAIHLVWSDSDWENSRGGSKRVFHRTDVWSN